MLANRVITLPAWSKTQRSGAGHPVAPCETRPLHGSEGRVTTTSDDESARTHRRRWRMKWGRFAILALALVVSACGERGGGSLESTSNEEKSAEASSGPA